MYLIDSHCHLHDQEWFTPEQAEQFLAAATAADVREVVVIGTDPVDSRNAQAFAAAHAGVAWTYGIHPEYANTHPIDQSLARDLQTLREALCDDTRAETPRDDTRAEVICGPTEAETPAPSIPTTGPCAIGEIGLDYHYDGYDRPAQIRLFEQMLQLAHDLDLPVSLHIRERDAFADAWPILDNFSGLTGVVHSFTGSKQELRRALDRGFYIGVNGLATYSTLPLPPLEKMLLETDAPFLTPIPFRGTINKPGYVREIATYLAGKMGVAVETIAEHTTRNARQLFHLRGSGLRPGRRHD